MQGKDEDFVSGTGWEESAQPAGMFMNKEKAGSVILGDAHVYRRRLSGMLKNADTLV
jgi:hypothetical protein